jgi:hypothetical protein
MYVKLKHTFVEIFPPILSLLVSYLLLAEISSV